MQRNCTARSIQNKRRLSTKHKLTSPHIPTKSPVKLSTNHVPIRKYSEDYVSVFPSGDTTWYGNAIGVRRTLNQRQKCKLKRHAQ